MEKKIDLYFNFRDDSWHYKVHGFQTFIWSLLHRDCHPVKKQFADYNEAMDFVQDKKQLVEETRAHVSELCSLF